MTTFSDLKIGDVFTIKYTKTTKQAAKSSTQFNWFLPQDEEIHEVLERPIQSGDFVFSPLYPKISPYKIEAIIKGAWVISHQSSRGDEYISVIEPQFQKDYERTKT